MMCNCADECYSLAMPIMQMPSRETWECFVVFFKPRLHDTTGCQMGLTTGWMFVYTIQPWYNGCQTALTTDLTTSCIVYTAGCQTGCTTRFDNRVEQTAVPSTWLSNRVWQLVERTLAVRSTRLLNRFDNRLDVCLHDAAGCQTGCRTG